MDWAELLPDLLSTIAKKLNLYEDFKAFGGVCRSWWSVAVKNNFCPVQVPWLLLPPPEDGDLGNSCDFYSLTKGGMVHKVHLPQAGGKTILSSLGWLITMDKDSGDMELMHPLSRTRISLPSACEYDYFDMLEAAVLSASPSDTDDYALMILIGYVDLLAYWKPGNTAWVTIEKGQFGVKDLVYHCGHFYSANHLGEILSIDINGSDPSTTANLVGTIPSEVVAGMNRFYLAESGGHLLAVVKELLHDNDQGSGPVGYIFATHHHHGIKSNILINKPTCNYMITSFQVYKFESSNNNWHLMNDLGGRSLFLSQQNCAPVSIPCAVGAAVRPDCIYFIDDINNFCTLKDDIGRGGVDMGVYSLKEQRVDTLYQGGTKGRCFLCRPLWVIPSF